jgi:hypothetical protein
MMSGGRRAVRRDVFAPALRREMPMAKKRIAVLVRDRQAEALRMAIGLTLANDEVHVFVMDRKLDESAVITLNIETLKELSVPLCSNNPQNNVEQMSTEKIALALVNYDLVIPY